MNKKELTYMINDYKDAIKLVKFHLSENPVSANISLWTNELHNLKKRLAELEECMYLGEYDE